MIRCQRVTCIIGLFSLAPDLGERALEDADLNVVRDLDEQFAVVLNLGNLADQPARGHDGIAAFDRGHHRLMGLHPLLLGSDNEKVKDTEQQDERYQTGDKLIVHSGAARVPLFGRFSREYSPVAPYCNLSSD